MFIFKKRSQFIASVYKNSDESLAVENNWCPRCLGLMGSACPDHDFSQTSYKAHGINNRPYSMSIRDAKTTNPILYRYQQEQIEKTLQMFSIIFDKLDE